MDKMKKYLTYIILLIVFAVFSEFLIAVGLNSAYSPIERNPDDLTQVVIYQAEATKVNGRIRGMINNDGENRIDKKYLKFEFFTDREINMGSKYVEIDNEKDETPIEIFFKLDNVSHYKVSFVDEKDPQGEIEFIPKDLNKSEIFVATLFAFLIFK